jgi:hypothetical protein
VKYKFEMNQIDGSEPLREILTFRRNVEKLRIGLNADADAPAIIGVQRMLHATALSSFNDGVRRYEKILIDQARSTRYNAYLLAHCYCRCANYT